jgi:hypothetical protein
MTKAKTPISPRGVIGNQPVFRKLSLDEASAALVALLSGVRVVPPRGELRKIARAVRSRRGSTLQTKEVRRG